MPVVLKPDTLVAATTPTFYFIGVTTGQSSIMSVFPKWAEYLGISQSIIGIDVPLDATPEMYRNVVEFIKHDSMSLGALVTTHKLNLFKSSRDLFDEIGESAGLLDEVSSISKRNGRLLGHAMDDVTSGLAFDHILEKDYWSRNGGELLILGAGGSSLALTLHLHRKKLQGLDVPQSVLVTNRRMHRIAEMKSFHKLIGFDIQIDYFVTPEPQDNDIAISRLSDHSMVINATGLGKDRPGSPLTNDAKFPENGYAWDFNYRGDLVFLEQARVQQQSRGVIPVDGWFYFLHGWTRVIAQVFELEIPTSGPVFDELSDIARSA
jgi:shikimate 5-dehydrogenase